MSAIYKNGNYYGGSVIQAGFTPVGTIISVMGVSAPANYLICNGQIVNIAIYPELATYFEQQFGSKNKFGGDGTTTFAVPDLRGEFLRGTGTNSHANQGSGANVGVHQDGTIYNQVASWSGGSAIGQKPDNSTLMRDFEFASGTFNRLSAGSDETTANWGLYTSRPTNTSVLYCIKAKSQGNGYSLDEQIVGTWIDGKPIYQKTYEFNSPVILTAGEWGATSIPIGNIDKIIHAVGYSDTTTSWEGLSATVDIGSYVNLIFFIAINVYKVTLQYTKTD